jgi:hypothetical protein
MTKSVEGAAQRRKLLGEIERLAEIAVFGSLSETYRTCGRAGCHCQGDGPKHGPHPNVSYRGEKGKTTGYTDLDSCCCRILCVRLCEWSRSSRLGKGFACGMSMDKELISHEAEASSP